MQSHAYAGGALLSNVLPFYLFAVYSILFLLFYFIIAPVHR